MILQTSPTFASEYARMSRLRMPLISSPLSPLPPCVGCECGHGRSYCGRAEEHSNGLIGVSLRRSKRGWVPACASVHGSTPIEERRRRGTECGDIVSGVNPRELAAPFGRMSEPPSDAGLSWSLASSPDRCQCLLDGPLHVLVLPALTPFMRQVARPDRGLNFRSDGAMGQRVNRVS